MYVSLNAQDVHKFISQVVSGADVFIHTLSRFTLTYKVLSTVISAVDATPKTFPALVAPTNTEDDELAKPIAALFPLDRWNLAISADELVTWRLAEPTVVALPI